MKQIDTTGRYSPMPDLEKATDEALVEWYNKHSGSTQIAKFASRETAVQKCSQLKQAMDELKSRSAAVSTASSKAAGVRKAKATMKKETKTAKTAAKGKAKSKTAAAKGGKAAKKTSGGRNGSLAGMVIYKKTDKNPRREGSIGFKSFALIRNGMTYNQYIDAGGRNKDLRWDEEHGFVEIKPAKK